MILCQFVLVKDNEQMWILKTWFITDIYDNKFLCGLCYDWQNLVLGRHLVPNQLFPKRLCSSEVHVTEKTCHILYISKWFGRNLGGLVAAGLRPESVAWYCCPNWLIVPVPDDGWIYSIGRMIKVWKKLGGKLAPLSTTDPTGLLWSWTWAFMMRNWWPKLILEC